MYPLPVVNASRSLPTAVLLYRFGPYEADLTRDELRKFGLRIRLEPKPWHLLIALLQRPGELVTRSELQRALWGEDVFVDFEHGLNVAVKKLRAMLEVDKNILTPQSSLQFAPCDQFPRPLEQRDKQVPDFGFEPDFQSELAQLDASEVGLVRTEPVQLPSRRR